MNAFAAAAPTLGHNQGPTTIADELATAHKVELDLKAELLEAFKTAPERIDDDITQTKAAELIKKTRALERKLEDARDRTKLPFEDTVKAIRGFFNTTIEPLEKARKALNERSQAYLQRKADEEKRRLAEEEEKRRAAAAEALRLAQEAEKAKTASTAAAQDAARLADEAAQARAAASSEQEAAAADLTAAKAAHAQIKANMLAFAAEVAIRAKNGDPIDEDEKAEKRRDFDDLLSRARAKVDAAEAVLKAARDRAIAAKQEADRLAREQAEADRKARAAERERTAALNEAVREEKAADKIAAKIEGPEADLARTRSLHGAVSTLERRWTWEVIDRSLLDKEALWPLLHEEAIRTALGKWALLQPPEKRVMAGARIEQETNAQVR